MKTTTSTKANKVIADAKKLTSSPIERKMIEELLKYGFVRTAIQKGFSTDDRTDKIVSICIVLGLNINHGNDAPKGGKVGNFVQNNGDKLITKFVEIQKRRNQILKSIEKRKEIEASERCSLQKIALVEYFTANPEFLNKIKNRIENFSSKNWRNWVRMKVCQVLNQERFGTFELGAVEIREAVYQVAK